MQPEPEQDDPEPTAEDRAREMQERADELKRRFGRRGGSPYDAINGSWNYARMAGLWL